MALSNIPVLDNLLAGQGDPLKAGSDHHAVGAVQDLLYGQGLPGMPGLSSGARGLFGPRTRKAVATFRRNHGLDPGEDVDTETLQKLVGVPAPRPLASQAYLTLALDRDFTPNLKVVSVVTRLAGAGRLAETRPNPDTAGLGFGLLPFDQKHGRLHDLLQALSGAQHMLMLSAFGGPTLLDHLIKYTGKPNNGIDAHGNSDDLRFELLADPWLTRFRKAGHSHSLQAAQVDWAKQFFLDTYQNDIKSNMPALASERAVAFAFDLILQFEAAGAKALYIAAVSSGVPDQAVLLASLRDAASEKLVADFGDFQQVVDASRDRRNFLIATTLLSDFPFAPDGTAPSTTPSAFPAARAASFFLYPRNSQALLPPVSGTKAAAIVGGKDGLAAMVAAIKEAKAKNDFIYMLNWHFDHTMELVPGSAPAAPPPPTSLQILLTDAANNGVQIRAMIWSGPTLLAGSLEVLDRVVPDPDEDNDDRFLMFKGQRQIDQLLASSVPELETNKKTYVFFDSLKNSPPPSPPPGVPPITRDVDAILDGERGLVGTHHQKLLVVRASGKLTAFVGGIEYNKDRLDPDPAHKSGSPLFDTTVRLEDRAAWLALQAFVDRWKSHPSNGGKADKLIEPNMAMPASTGGSLMVQFTHTYGRGYSPRQGAPIWTASDAIANGILNARQFFYIEDQYFVGSPKLGTAIRQAFLRTPGLYGIMVIASEVCVTDLDRSLLGGPADPPPNNKIGSRRRDFLKFLRTDYPGRFLVFERFGVFPATGQPALSGDGAYIHSKLVIVDDEAAFVGSVNCNRRSWYHDSEIDATFVDANGPGGTSVSQGWVRDLRVRVWAQHLGSPCDGDPVKDIDRWAGIVRGDKAPSLFPYMVCPYDQPPVVPPPDLHPAPSLWDNLYDPN
jgi:hypothetical protein